MKLLGNLDKGLLFVLSAPSGTGKTTLVNMLLDEFSCIERSISFTTREVRKGERQGVDYHYVSQKEFLQRIEREEFLEHAHVFGNYYGSSNKEIMHHQNLGKHVVLVIDTQGALQLMKLGLDMVSIFILPPSLEALGERLIKRSSESESDLERRLSLASTEIACAKKYDYCVVNDDLSVAYAVLRSIFIAEEHRIMHR